MPIIKSSTYLQSNYDEISKLCHSSNKPVFITDADGNIDLVVMSIKLYEKLSGSGGLTI